MLLTDLDGSFAEQPFCAGCHVLRSSLVGSRDAFPDCYYDARYEGSVCKPNLHFVVVGFTAKPPCGPCANPPVRVSYRGEDGIYVKADDASYLRNKWRPQGKFNLVELDVTTEQVTLSIVGEHDTEFQGSWRHATGTWLTKHRLAVEFDFVDQFDTYEKKATQYEAIISQDGSTLTWLDNTATLQISTAEIDKQIQQAQGLFDRTILSNESYQLRVAEIMRMGESHPINGTRQLFTDVVWYRCESLPHKCAADAIKYPDEAGATIGRQAGSFQIRGNLL